MDHFSAVDTHVGRHLFDRVIGPNGLLKDKTRILVTHRISVLPFVDKIIVLKDGSISELGTFEELIERKGHFSDFVTEYLLEQSDSDHENGEIDVIKRLKEQIKPLIDKNIDQSIKESVNSEGIRKRRLSKRSSSFMSDKSNRSVKTEEKESPQNVTQKSNGKLTEAETSETGSVRFKVYKNYIYLIGFYFNLIIFVSFCVANVAQVLAGLWLSEWSNDSLDVNKTKDIELRDFRLGVYAGIGIIESIFSLTANLSVSLGCIRAAKLLHNLMMKRVIRAPMAFFGESSFKSIHVLTKPSNIRHDSNRANTQQIFQRYRHFRHIPYV